jgi:hypothetical protein
MTRTRLPYLPMAVAFTVLIFIAFIAVQANATDDAPSTSWPDAPWLTGTLTLTEEFPLDPAAFQYTERRVHRFRGQAPFAEREGTIQATVVRDTLLSDHPDLPCLQHYTIQLTQLRQTYTMRDIDLSDMAVGLAQLKARRAELIDAATTPTDLSYCNAAVEVELLSDGQAVTVRLFHGSVATAEEKQFRGPKLPASYLDDLEGVVQDALAKIAELKAE